MPADSIDADDPAVVLINIFKCDARQQDALVEHLTALVRIQSSLPGFVSASLHRA